VNKVYRDKLMLLIINIIIIKQVDFLEEIK